MNRELTKNLAELASSESKAFSQGNTTTPRPMQDFMQRELQLAESRRECELLRKEIEDLRYMSEQVDKKKPNRSHNIYDQKSIVKKSKKPIPDNKKTFHVSSTSDAFRIILFEIRRLQISLGNVQNSLNESQAQVSERRIQ